MPAWVVAFRVAMQHTAGPPERNPAKEELVSEDPPEADEPQTLAEALSRREVELPDEVVARLDAYRIALWDWNGKLNLTRHTTLDKFVTRDIGDSLELANLLQRGERVLDVGSGGGVPGIPLAILRPDLKVTLCDSVAKKSRVLEDLVRGLQLKCRVYPARVQDVLAETTYDTLVARAVAPLRKMLVWLEPCWDAFDRLLVIKGKSWVDERGEARHHGVLQGLELRKAAEYKTRGTDSVSVVLSVRRGASG